MARHIDVSGSLEREVQQTERGQRFGHWFRTAVANSGKTINAIAIEIGVSKPQLYIFRDNCIASDGRFKRPSDGMIRKIAAATYSNAGEGLQAIFGEDLPSAPVPEALAALPADAQQALAQAVQTIRRGEVSMLEDKIHELNARLRLTENLLLMLILQDPQSQEKHSASL